MTCAEKRTQDMLLKVIERNFDYLEAIKSENAAVREAAVIMFNINIWEMWALTQE